LEQKINWEEFKSKLIELNGKIETIEEISRHKGDKFNIFSILGIQRREVETHSFLLYELINPKGSHCQGDLYLKIFLEEILKARDKENKEDIQKDIFKIDDILDDVKVDRETFISRKSMKNGRIDFIISNDEYYIAIEMKIDSLENDNQLDNYKDFLNELKNKKTDLKTQLCYLTLFGDKADKSEIKEDEYIRISFLEHISNFIEKSIEKSATLPTIRENLIQYQTTIRNITNQSAEGMQMEVIKMINNPQMARTATELSKNLAYAWAKREVIFWRKLTEKLNDCFKNKGWEVIPNILYDYDDKISNNDDFIASWIVESLRKTDGRGIVIKKGVFLFSIWLFNKYSFEYHIPKKYKNLANTIEFKESRHIPIYYKSSQFKYNFSKDSENPTYNVFDDKLLDEIVNKIYEEIVYYMDKIIESRLYS
jgi:hypothetical protein